MRGDRPVHRRLSGPQNPFTPHARGSTPNLSIKSPAPFVYPACAGIDPLNGLVDTCLVRLPRMRGDRPARGWAVAVCRGFTPHARGSTVAYFSRKYHIIVYPACAGIDLFVQLPHVFGFGLLRMRGDRPDYCRTVGDHYPFTPHARGSTLTSPRFWQLILVYPACAGIDPASGGNGYAIPRLPRMRGDRPLEPLF